MTDVFDVLGGHAPDQPVTGWKVGMLWWTGEELCLSGVGGPPRGSTADRLYRVDDVARCARGGEHVAPDPACTCGFWSVIDRDDLGGALGRVDVAWADLRVESSGTVVVHDRGLRSRRQRVLAVFVDERCAECGRPPVRLGADKPGPVTARCRVHLPSVRTGWSDTLAGAAGELGTEVRFERRTWAPSATVVAEATPDARTTRVRWIAGALAIAGATVVGGAALVDAGGPTTPLPSSPAPPASVAR